MYKTSIAWGVVLCASAVILGALGAHYLKAIFTAPLLQSFETGVRYQMYHGLALIALGIYAKFFHQSIKWIFVLILSGTLLFSGSIYILCIFKATMDIGLGGLGLLTPIGGVCMIIGWLLWLNNIRIIAQ